VRKVSESINSNQRYRQRILEAAKRGDMGGVEAELTKFSVAVQSAHNDKLHHLGVALEYIQEKLGEDALADVWRRSFEDIKLPAALGEIGHDSDKLVASQASVKDRIASAVTDSTYTITETDDTVSFDYTACPSGGVFRRGGVKDDPSKFNAFGRKWQTIKGKHSWTLNESGLHPYCVHCGVLNDIYKEKGLLIEFQYGKNPPTDPCRFVIHKQKSSKP
jgi:hypothetical protein